MKLNLKSNVRFLMVAVILITAFSCCSFVFETNPWVDTNIMFTCGRSMLDGKIIYADIIDHKGPVLYFIYLLAALISSTSYFGIYLIEIICLTIFLYYSNTISCLIFEKDLNMAMVFTLGILTVSSQAFKFGGGSAEEFMLSIMQMSIYLVIKDIYANNDISFKSCFLLGILCSIVFLTKFILCGLFLGLLLVCLLHQYKVNKKRILQSLLYAIGGFLIPIALAVFYFVSVNSLEEFINVYFIKNLFGYGEEKSFIKNILFAFSKGAYILTKGNILLVILSLLGLVFVKQTNIRNYLVVIFISWYIVTFIGGIYNVYYLLPISLFLIYFVGWLNMQPHGLYGAIVISLMCSFKQNNLSLIGKDLSCVDDISDCMKSVVNNPTFTMYNCAVFGIYLESGYTPQCSYFTSINTSNNEYENVVQSCIFDNHLDFVITRDEEIIFNGYSLFDEFYHDYEGINRIYRLYINDSLLN